MTAFRPLDPFQVYTDLDGNLAAGGTLHFYAAGTTTDADVYGDEDLTVNNGATIAIGTDGRAVDDIWGDGTLSYRCRVYAADGTLIRDRDNISLPGGTASALPVPVDGEFLAGAGGVWVTTAIRQALDPTGQANKIEGSDGQNQVWVAKPADGAAGANGTNAAVTVTSTSVKWSNGDGDLFFIQMGSATAPASGVPSTSQAVTFPTAFKTTPRVFVTTTGNSYATDGKLGIPAITAVTTTGFTVGLDTNTTTDNIFADVPFDWIALGTVAA